MLFGLPPIYADTTDFTARTSIVQGYNTNVYQAQDDPAVPILRRHPSLFTGVEGMGQVHVTGQLGNEHDLRINARAQHYEAPGEADDWTVNGAWTSAFSTSERLHFTMGAAATLTTLSSTHVADGTLFQIDPTSVRRTFYLGGAFVGVGYDISPVWRILQRFGSSLSGTVNAVGVRTPSGVFPTSEGLDFVGVESDTTLLRDFSERTTGGLRVVLGELYSLYVLDLTQAPPKNIGPQEFRSALLQATHQYRFSDELTSRLGVGAIVATPPPLDPNRTPVIAPSLGEQLIYMREDWSLAANAGYTYGSLSPRLGAGPSISAGFTFVGVPRSRGRWRHLSVVASGTLAHSDLSIGNGTPSTSANALGVAVQARYGVSSWLGLLAGYELHYAVLSAENQITPALVRNIFYVGLSGYWSTSPAAPPLTVLQPPARM